MSALARVVLSVLVIIAVIAILVAAFDGADDDARRVLEAQGYSDIELTGYDAFACSEDDLFRSGFTATAPGGGRVSGTVCGGPLKGSTIRFKVPR